jgi:uncharacterized protein
MADSKVYFTDMSTTPSLNLLGKLEKLVTEAGLGQMNLNKKLVALKVHFGEPGNLAYLRPNFAATIAAMVIKKGGRPFVTDCNTLYSGRRSNAPDHLNAAFANGYNPLSAGCNVIIADGIKGTEYREIEINREFTGKAKIGSAIADADVVISLNHFKGHEQTGFGGALKNLGMGCASVGGKLFLHSGNSPEIYAKNCTGCGMCEENCAYGAVHVREDMVAFIDTAKCIGCGQCVAVCQYDAARVVWGENAGILSKKISEYALAVVTGKQALHINFIMNVSPNCDCWGYNDIPLVSDIGILASTDPVALDKACADLVLKAPVNRGSKITPAEISNDLTGEDKFRMAHPATDWHIALEHGQKIGLGSTDYDLVKI